MDMCACLTSDETDAKNGEKSFFEKMASMMCEKMMGDKGSMEKMMDKMACCDDSSSCCESAPSGDAAKKEEPQAV